MRRTLAQLIPSMFHRRLTLLLLGAVAVAGVLCLQLWNLTVVQGAVRRQEAQERLSVHSVVPTIRGRIWDRGSKHVLAVDEPSYDVAVKFPVLTYEWASDRAGNGVPKGPEAAHEKAGLFAKQDLGAARWKELTPEEREAVRDRYLEPYNRQTQQLWVALAELTATPPAELEERKAAIIRRVQWLKSYLGNLHQAEQSAKLDEAVELGDVIGATSEESLPQIMVADISESARLQIEHNIARAAVDPDMAVWSQVSIVDAKKRLYPMETQKITLDRSTLPAPLRQETPTTLSLDGVGTHVVGRMHHILKRELEDPSQRWSRSKGYTEDDRIGAFGLERMEEPRLRGTPGWEERNIETSALTHQYPAPGEDVVASIDIDLQARIQAIMDPRPVGEGGLGLMREQPWYQHAIFGGTDKVIPLDQPLTGAAVVLDIASGQVLAAVSIPTMDAGGVDDPIDMPYINRVVGMSFSPGSTVKPLVLAAAVTGRVIGINDTVNCTGQLFPGGPRCWTMTYGGPGHSHGPLNGVSAIAQSCDVFFYTMGERLGATRLVEWYDRYGLGSPTGCGFDEEIGGDLPDPAKATTPNAHGFTERDAILMGIGEGPIGWTPLQGANAYATLARAGLQVSPTFLSIADGSHEQTTADLHLDPAGVDSAMKGLYAAVHDEHGQSRFVTTGPGGREPIFNIKGVTIYGKTGTADTSPQVARIDGVRQVVRFGAHAWFMALVQREGSSRPDYVIAVVVAHSGSGGAVAGPIVNQILYAMRAGNYL